MILRSTLFRRVVPLIGALLPLSSQAENPQMLLICVNAIEENSKVALASKNADGAQRKHGEVILRSPLVSEWISVPRHEIHLVSGRGAGLKSLAGFAIPADARRALVVIIPGNEPGTYRPRVIDAHTQGFSKGSTLILNLSREKATVAFDESEAVVESGKNRVITPTDDGDGGYRLTVSREVDGQAALCYDRQRVASDRSRNLLVLMDEETVGMRVEGMPLFDGFD